MKTITLLLEPALWRRYPPELAGAGPCTTEIDNVTKLLASKDAGAGPDLQEWQSATTGQHPPSATMGAADPSTSASSAAADSGRPQHPPTAAMDQATQGGGPSSQAGSSAREQHPPTAAMGQAAQRRRPLRRRTCRARTAAAPHGGAAGGRRPTARVRQPGVGAGGAQRGPRLRSGRPGSRLHGCDSTGEAARRLIQAIWTFDRSEDPLRLFAVLRGRVLVSRREAKRVPAT